MLNFPVHAPLQLLNDEAIAQYGFEVYVKREDLIHPIISGNKWRKLKYNLQTAKEQGQDTLLTFGGAYSNHIAATAYAGQEFGFKTIGIIRGEELKGDNSTLSYARECGMQLDFISRESYKHKEEQHFKEELIEKYGLHYLIPEGGANNLGLKGCSEIVDDIPIDFDWICCACGTATTLSGIISALASHQKALGISVLKGAYSLNDVVASYLPNNIHPNQWEINHNYHHGGYAKLSDDLLQFMKGFEQRNGLLLDPVYTGKLFYAVYDLIAKGFFPSGSRIVLLHTGGLQGRKGFSEFKT
jgi:1-aminocyclopropane-1-carboxylate deaminase/D-cysteine desulfhydrase-like pyridoxal-dependent ACC family enzyme